MAEFFQMGGYAGYVWATYGAAAVILIGLLVMSIKDLRARQTEIAALEASSPRRRRQSEEAE
jgi:heme exporter protein D